MENLVKLAKHLPWTAAVLGAIGSNTYFLLHTVGQDYYKSWNALVDEATDQPLPVPNEFNKLIEQASDDMLLDPIDEIKLDVFMCGGQYPMHIGSTHLAHKCKIGLPFHFTFNSPEDAAASKMIIDEERLVDWTSMAGTRLKEALVLSSDAKRFVLARELNYTKHYYVHNIGTLNLFTYLAAFYSCYFANVYFSLTKRLKLWARGGVYTVIVGAWIFIYAGIKTNYQISRDCAADKETAMLGYSYAVGGLEYYNKVLERNIALRELLGAKGQHLYTAHGNEAGLIDRHMPDITRRDTLKDIVQGYESGQITAQKVVPRKRIIKKEDRVA